MNCPDVQWEELTTDEGRKWNEQCHSSFYDEGYVQLGDVKGVFARSYISFYKRIQNFPIRKDDVWVVSFPKCGTTWTQEMVWCIANNLNYEGAKTDLQKRFPYFELRANWSPQLASRIEKTVLQESSHEGNNNENTSFFLNSFNLVEQAPSPRFIKSHLHLSLLPQGIRNSVQTGISDTKLIYVARNPKATCVSFFHHSCLLDGYGGTLADFVDAFVTDNVFCSPYWTHLKEFWDIRLKPNVLFLKYEDMKENLESVIHKTAEFLGKDLSDVQVQGLKEHLTFDSMKTNPAVNYEGIVQNMQKMHGRIHETTFMRKGQIDSWKDELTDDMNSKLDHWINNNRIEGLYD